MTTDNRYKSELNKSVLTFMCPSGRTELNIYFNPQERSIFDVDNEGMLWIKVEAYKYTLDVMTKYYSV